MAARLVLFATVAILGACSREATTPREASSAKEATEAKPRGPVAVGDRRRVDGPFPIPIPGAKITLIEYFATWCPSSQRWLPKVEAMKQRYGSAGLVVIAVPAVDESSVPMLEDFLRDARVTFPLAPDEDHHIFDTFRPPSWGQSLVAVDAQGVVRLVHHQTRDGDGEYIESAIKTLLAVP